MSPGFIPILILGAGGQARVVIDMLARIKRYQPLGCLWVGDAVPEGLGDVLGVPVLGVHADMATVAEMHLVTTCALAIGDNAMRAEVSELARESGFHQPCLIDPSAVVSEYATVGEGSVVCPQAFVGPGASLGRGVIVNTTASVDHDCEIGDFAHIAVGGRLAGNVSVGERSLIGAGCVALPGVSVGSRTIVGAGSLITREIGDDQTFYQQRPAPIIKPHSRP